MGLAPVIAGVDRSRLLSGDLSDYQPFHAARADLCARAGLMEESRAAYADAMRLSSSEREKVFLQRRMDRARVL